jgi:lipopolysaccharide transport system permease protein
MKTYSKLDSPSSRANFVETSFQEHQPVGTTLMPAEESFSTKPLITIQAGKPWQMLQWRELWAHRELLYFLTWRDVKVRYKQTLLGGAWAILQPLLTMVIFTLLFGRLAGFASRTGGVPYPVFAFAGLLPWTFFSNAITNSGNSLINSANLITKVYFPRMIVPGAAVTAGLVDFAIGFMLLIVLMFYYRLAPGWGLVLLPFLVLLTTLLAVAVGMWLSALNVKYRDVRFAIPFVVQIWMFLSPIIYPTSLIPQKLRFAFLLNPMTGIIDGYRTALFGQPMNWMGLAISTMITILAFAYASFVFRRMERGFADII